MSNQFSFLFPERLKGTIHTTGDVDDLSDLEKFRVFSDQVTSQVRSGAEEMGYEDNCLTEEEARSLIVGVSIFQAFS